MKSDKPHKSIRRKWAEHRFSVIGNLLANPPMQGKLRERIRELAKQTYLHPLTGQKKRWSVSSLERWYYIAKDSENPVDELFRKAYPRQENKPFANERITALLKKQYLEHPGWTQTIHYENLQALVRSDPTLGDLPSYSSLCRWLKARGMLRQKRKKEETSSYLTSRNTFSSRETRSFEAPFPGNLWHLDFHKARRRVLTARGEWIVPSLLAILDDHSRLICHMQWYEEETTDVLVHGFCQALLKRGVPWKLLNDNGSSMTSCEFIEGLERLSIEAHTTLPYCPEQNGKQERFFGTLESRLMSQLENKKELTLKELNDFSAAWMELGYNNQIHKETGKSPVSALLASKNLHREAPSQADLTFAFTRQVTRKPRHFDASISIDGTRYEIPWVYRHLKKVIVRTKSWDLSTAWLVEEDGKKPIAKIHPINKASNSQAVRRLTQPQEHTATEKEDSISPLIAEMMAEYAATGLPMPYIEKKMEKK